LKKTIITGTILAKLIFASAIQAQDVGAPLHTDSNVKILKIVKTPEQMHSVKVTGKKFSGSKTTISIPFITIIQGVKSAGYISVDSKSGVKPSLALGAAAEKAGVKAGLSFKGLNIRTGSTHDPGRVVVTVVPGVSINFGKGWEGTFSKEPGKPSTFGFNRVVELSPELRKQVFGKLSIKEIAFGLKTELTKRNNPNTVFGVQVKAKKTTIGVSMSSTKEGRAKGAIQLRQAFKDGSIQISWRANLQKGSLPTNWLSVNLPLKLISKKPDTKKQYQYRKRRR